MPGYFKRSLVGLLIVFLTAGLFAVSSFAEEGYISSEYEYVAEDEQHSEENYNENAPLNEIENITGENEISDGKFEENEVTLEAETQDISKEDEVTLETETQDVSKEDEVTLEIEKQDISKEDESNKKIQKVPQKTEEKTSAEEITTEEETTKKEIFINSITLNIKKADLATKKTLKINATVKPEDATEKIVWKSSDDSIAIVDNKGNVTAKRYGKVTITASGTEGKVKSECEIDTKFFDVNDVSKYFYMPVYWAADKKITEGYDNVYFGPQRKCTRREMTLFLWRYSGKPAASAKIPFNDTKYGKNTDSYKAISWAVGKGIIKGYGDGSFKPERAVSRKEAMIMLYRLAGSPKASGDARFSDITTKKYSRTSASYKAILWGTTVGITNGYSNGKFKPDDPCLREHIVTFLYRYKDNKSKNAYLNTPSSLSVQSDKNTLKFSWKAVKGAAEYDVYRWIYSKNKYEKIASTKATSYNLKGVKNGDKHTFKVAAKSGKVKSDISKAKAGVFISTPKLKSASAVTTGLRVKWNKVSGADGYKVYRKTAKSGWKSIGSTYETQFTDTSVKNNTKYFYTVKAYKDVSKIRYYSYYDAKGKSALIKNKRGLTFSKNGRTYKYMEAYMGTTRQELVAKLSKHENDNYYNNTPYAGGDHRNVSGDPYHTYSSNDVYGKAGVNCTGFVWRLLYDGGCDYHYIPNMVGSRYCWQNPKDPRRNTWYSFSKGDAGFVPVHYKYKTVKALLADGKAKKGDVIYMLQTGQPNPYGGVDSHVGIFWGDSPSDNKLWHSGPTTEYGPIIKSAITEINAGSPSIYYLFTWAN